MNPSGLQALVLLRHVWLSSDVVNRRGHAPHFPILVSSQAKMIGTKKSFGSLQRCFHADLYHEPPFAQEICLFLLSYCAKGSFLLTSRLSKVPKRLLSVNKLLSILLKSKQVTNIFSGEILVDPERVTEICLAFKCSTPNHFSR